ncbi:hypothetical protein [Paenibacillus glycanilyticus]|uniref:Peptidase M10 metallopeptidase domain-containing protein n=1 Tax=Paenibacillus glycanilyticus TaxID=126569 RepID=A0ABQ6GBD0_9BACL|nr:hypothetical protein [Paenibacillus glycanilyticus]GLX66626.1 hypothetical protein MU1_09700 [Paenibacillus glycanilyticus]
MKRFICAVLIFTLLLSANVVFANTDPDWGSQSPNINVPPITYNNTWKTPMEAAASAWNGTATLVTVGTLSSSKNSLIVSSYSDTWYGNSSSANPGPFTIKLNSRTINRDATDFANFVQSVLVHEYGHEFCLDHTSQTSIMNDSRNRNTMKVPQPYDVSEVNTVYN